MRMQKVDSAGTANYLCDGPWDDEAVRWKGLASWDNTTFFKVLDSYSQI